MRSLANALLVLIGGLLFTNPAQAQESEKEIVIKMATLAPKGSPWFELLEDIRQEWLDLSEGRVIIKLYSGGGFGDESDIVVRLRLDQVQAAAVTTEGLGVIDKGVWAFSIPTLFESDRQLEWVRRQTHSEFLSRFDRAGAKLVMWIDLGWSYWFSRVPIRTPDDLRELRIYNWAAIDLQQVWKAGGYHAVRLSSVDILPGLQTGLIDCFATTPLMAGTFQWFGPAKNMTQFKWGALIGGIIISNHVWDQIPAELQPQLLEAAEQRSQIFQQVAHTFDEQAIEAMIQYGLRVIEITPQEEAAWRVSVAPHLKLLRGTLVDAAMFDRVFELMEHLPDELREQ